MFSRFIVITWGGIFMEDNALLRVAEAFQQDVGYNKISY